MSDRDEHPLDALATKISELHSYNGNEQAAAADEAFDAVADLLAEKSKALEKAERERDEARDCLRFLRANHDITGKRLLACDERLEQALALLREIRDADHDNRAGGWPGAGDMLRDAIGKIDDLLAGQPAPAKPVVDDATVFRLCAELHYRGYNIGPIGARAALVAALEGRT